MQISRWWFRAKCARADAKLSTRTEQVQNSSGAEDVTKVICHEEAHLNRWAKRRLMIKNRQKY